MVAAGRSSGTPLHVVDICQWLKWEQLVEGGQLTAKAAGVELGKLVPHSLTAIVQAQVDQLPTSLVEVLRSASVLGVMFNAGVLQAMLSHRVSGDAEMLDYQLHALQESNLIAPAGRREYDRTCGYSEHDDIWKVGAPPIHSAATRQKLR